MGLLNTLLYTLLGIISYSIIKVSNPAAMLPVFSLDALSIGQCPQLSSPPCKMSPLSLSLTHIRIITTKVLTKLRIIMSRESTTPAPTPYPIYLVLLTPNTPPSSPNSTASEAPKPSGYFPCTSAMALWLESNHTSFLLVPPKCGKTCTAWALGSARPSFTSGFG